MKKFITAMLLITLLSCSVATATDEPTEKDTTEVNTTETSAMKQTTPATPESIKNFKGNWVLHNEGVKDTVILDFGETSYLHNAILGNVNDSNFSKIVYAGTYSLDSDSVYLHITFAQIWNRFSTLNNGEEFKASSDTTETTFSRGYKFTDSTLILSYDNPGYNEEFAGGTIEKVIEEVYRRTDLEPVESVF